MRRCMGLALVALLGLAGTLRAAPLDCEQVAADAKWLAHIDIDSIKDSALAEKVHEHLLQKHPEAEDHLAKFAEVWHFNPLFDLHGVTLYGTKLKKDTGVVIVNAKVDQELLLKKARQAPQHRESTHGQYQLHTWKHADGTKHEHDMTGVFFRPDVIVFGGSLDEVEAALDVLDGTKPNLAGKDSPLAAKVPAGTFVLACVAGLDKAKDLPNEPPMLKQVKAITLAIGENDGDSFMTGRMTVKKPEFAEQMKQIVEGARAMALMAHNGDAEAAKIINALKIDIDDIVIELKWEAPVDEFLNFLKKVEEKKQIRKDRMSLRLSAELKGPDQDEDEDQDED